MGRKRRRKLSLRWLLIWSVLVGGIGFVGYGWYARQERPQQEQVELVVLRTLDVLREWDETPRELKLVLDVVADWMPVNVGVILDPGELSGDRHYLFAGAPTGPAAPGRILRNTGYLAGYDDSRGNPAWVAYRVEHVDHGQVPERPEGFVADRRTRAKIGPEAYTHSGFDRGHMAPNYAIALCYGAEAQEETFLMSNIVPQVPELNREAWRELEMRIARRFTARMDEVWVLTGPIYGASPQRLAGQVDVPEAFYMLILDETEQGIRALALLIPNAPLAGSIHDYLVSIDTIEARTGLDFYADLPDEMEAAFESAANKRVW